MPPQSRGQGQVPPGFQSRSTPNLSSLRITTSMKPATGADETSTPSTARQYTSTAAAETAEAIALRSQSPPVTSPSEPASIEDNDDDDDGDDTPEMFTLDASTSSDEDALTRPVDDYDDEQHERRRSLPTSRSYTLLPHSAHPSSLYPPFYNRPPTPLPPSPSLTSLLRPPFSTHPSSRPTTPDSSDIEYNSAATATTTTTNGGAAAAANPNLALSKSARLAPTSVPRASPKVPTYEYYGFALYLASSVAFLIYCLWSFLPSPFLHRLGINYYLNRWWALATPAWLVILVLYIYVALASYNTQYLTLPMQSCENLVDEAGVVGCVDRETGRIIKPTRRGGGNTEARAGGGGAAASGGKGKSIEAAAPREPDTKFLASEVVDWKKLWSIGTDGVIDIPVGGVCEILYGGGSDVETE